MSAELRLSKHVLPRAPSNAGGLRPGYHGLAKLGHTPHTLPYQCHQALLLKAVCDRLK